MNFIWSLLPQFDINCCDLQWLQFSIYYGTFCIGKWRRGRGTSAAQGKFKRMWCLVKTWRGNEGGWREEGLSEGSKPKPGENKASLVLWASGWPGMSCKAWEWIILCASHQLPGRPQHCFVLQICSPTESDLTGGFAPELFKQKPCVMERAPCDFGTGLPVLRFLVSGWAG